MIRLGSQIGWPAQRQCNTAHARSRMLSRCKHRRGRGTTVVLRKYQSSKINKNESEDQNPSSPKLIGIPTVLRCVFGPKLVILAWTADELWCEQSQNEVKFEFQVKFDLEGHGQSSPKTIETQTKLFCMCGDPSLNGRWVIVQTSLWLTHTHTDTQTNRHSRWQYPKAKTGLGYQRAMLYTQCTNCT